MRGASPRTYALAALVLAGCIAAVLYLSRGERYRLYLSSDAAHCWEAVQALAPSSSSLRLAGVDVRDADGAPDVIIGYHMDRVLGGLELEARCTYPDGGAAASSIVLNGQPLDAESLERVNRRP